MKVFKFGGASVKDANSIRNVARILAGFQGSKLVVVISAMGKTTNALENVVKSYMNQDGKANDHLYSIKKFHFNIAEELLPGNQQVKDELNDLFVEIDWVLEETPQDPYDYIYDQLVSVGELLSTHLINAYLESEGLNSQWFDIRNVLITDNTYREARVDWSMTNTKINHSLKALHEKVDIVVSQGFIGSSTENFTTTLGREGSDFSAAILSYCLDAESLHIWKDVPGILTADPRIFEDVTLINRLSYKEATEMTYYGAKVIHPKTIKPLQNKQIPLNIRSFATPEAEGTWISNEGEIEYPPVVVVEPNQVLLHISTNDFSFVAEHHLSRIFTLFNTHRIKVNMMRNTAISFTVCTNDKPRRIQAFMEALGDQFNVRMDKDLELVTIRHFTDSIMDELSLNKMILFKEILGKTVQMVMKEMPIPKRK